MSNVPSIISDGYAANKNIVHISIDLEKGAEGIRQSTGEEISQTLTPLSETMRSLNDPILQIWVNEGITDRTKGFFPYFIDGYDVTTRWDHDTGNPRAEVPHFYVFEGGELDQSLDWMKILQEFPDKNIDEAYAAFFEKFPKAKEIYEADGAQLDMDLGAMPHTKPTLKTGEKLPITHDMYIEGQSADSSKDVFFRKFISNAFGPKEDSGGAFVDDTDNRFEELLQEVAPVENSILVFSGQNYGDCLARTVWGAIERGYQCVVVPELTNYIEHYAPEEDGHYDADLFRQKVLKAVGKEPSDIEDIESKFIVMPVDQFQQELQLCMANDGVPAPEFDDTSLSAA